MRQLAFLLTLFSVIVSAADWRPIHNDCFWNDTAGQPIYSQGGGIFRFGSHYYWYGVHYVGAEAYRADPSLTSDDTRFVGVECYMSDNMTDWTYAGRVLTPDSLRTMGRVAWVAGKDTTYQPGWSESPEALNAWVGRMGVCYLSEISKYCMAIQFNDKLLFLTADRPTGPFRWHRLKNMKPLIGTTNTGDQTVFTDPDTGLSYLIYSYGRGRNHGYVSRIGVRGDSIDLMDCHDVYRGESREGNCMFKAGGKYYLCASNIYGWDGSLAYWLVADNIYGPYTPTNDMQPFRGCELDYSHVSQTGFFYTLREGGRELVLFCGDRWSDFAGNGLGYNQWMPVTIDSDGTPRLHSLSSWELSHATAEWRVAEGNNYVLNPSFEADRRRVPNPVKPRQEWLTGWTTEIIKGHDVANEDSLSPKLNYENTRDDRLTVIGEKSLMISDTESFTRRVCQTISALPAGTYTMRVKAKASRGFNTLYIYAGARRQAIVPKDGWQTVTLTDYKHSGGDLTIGIYAEGAAGACCLIDDVEVKS